MKKLQHIKELIKKNRALLKERYKVKRLGIFGSYSRGKAKADSDVDILVEFFEPPDFFEFIRLENFLKDLFGVKVDLVTRKALKPLIRNAILKETVYV